MRSVGMAVADLGRSLFRFAGARAEAEEAGQRRFCVRSIAELAEPSVTLLEAPPSGRNQACG
jgi:hypothetical protein